MVLEQLPRDFDDTFIIIDALDECPLQEREELLDTITQMAEGNFRHLHIFTTSRQEPDIVKAFDSHEKIAFQASMVDEDIRKYVQETMQNNPRIQKWPEETRNQVREILAKQANGM